VFLQGLYKYQVESFHDMIGEKDAEKKDKECYNNHFRSMASYLTRQSESRGYREPSRAILTTEYLYLAAAYPFLFVESDL